MAAVMSALPCGAVEFGFATVGDAPPLLLLPPQPPTETAAAIAKRSHAPQTFTFTKFPLIVI
jgi:hypothetical protein